MLASAGAACGCRQRRPRAHGFGQRYELPLPLGLYLFGAAAAVALSFVVFGLFVRRAPAARSRAPQVDLLATPVGRDHRPSGRRADAPARRARRCSWSTILAGLLGDQNPYRNIAPTLVWIVWWVGLAYRMRHSPATFGRSSTLGATVFDGARWLVPAARA